MNLKDNKYAQYYLCREMMDTVEVIRKFNPATADFIAASAQKTGHILFSGEGSSRIMPAKNAIRKALRFGIDTMVHTEGSHQASEYKLDNYTVLLDSNSGRTKETLMLAKQLKAAGHKEFYGVTANADTPLEEVCQKTVVLSCGWENAVAATKSVVEQTLLFESVIWKLAGKDIRPELNALADKVEKALTLSIPAEVINWVRGAKTIYFAGMNDGVTEELTLKTNEITRRKSDFLEGTYALHGIEEVMEDGDIVFVVEPIESEYEKYQKVFSGANVHVVAIDTKPTPFTTVVVPEAGDLQAYVYLAAGWNTLVEIAQADGINLDKPNRARKVGNEM